MTGGTPLHRLVCHLAAASPWHKFRPADVQTHPVVVGPRRMLILRELSVEVLRGLFN